MNKTITGVFALIFGLIGVTAFVGVFLGYTHQLVIGIISMIVAIVAYRDNKGR